MTSKSQSRSILCALGTCRMRLVRPFIIMLMTASLSSSTTSSPGLGGPGRVLSTKINVGTDVIHPIELGSTRNCHTLYTSHYRNNLIPQLKCGGSLHSETHVERDDLGLGAGVVSCAFLFACPANRDAGIGANEVNKCPTCTLAVTQIPNKATYTIMKQSLMLSPAQTKLNMIASMVKI